MPDQVRHDGVRLFSCQVNKLSLIPKIDTLSQTMVKFMNRKLPVFFFFCLIFTLHPSAGYGSQAPPLPVIQNIPLPKSMNLCGEKMPLDNPYVREMLDRELTISAWDRAQVFMWLKRAGRYFPHIERELKKKGLPDDLKYLAVAESALITNIRSPKGARGTWQFMAQTARRNGLRKDRFIDERRHFERSTEAALNHLKDLKVIFGKWALAFAAYNCGEPCINRAIRKQKVRDYYRLNLPRETERYIFRIAAIKCIMKDPGKYGYRITPESTYEPVSCDIVKVRIRYPVNITKLAKALGTDFKVIKELNPYIIGDFLARGKYSLKVPRGKGPGVLSIIKRLTPPRPSSKKKLKGGYYIVRPGDTLNVIARKAGVPVKTLKSMNNIRGSLILIGQQLRIKP